MTDSRTHRKGTGHQNGTEKHEEVDCGKTCSSQPVAPLFFPNPMTSNRRAEYETGKKEVRSFILSARQSSLFNIYYSKQFLTIYAG